MNVRPIALHRLLGAAGIALALPLAAQAQPVPDYYGGFLADAMPIRSASPGDPMPGCRDSGAPGPHRAFGGPDDPLSGPPLLRELSLTEAQRDKVFAILHAQAPAFREKAKAARRAQDDLRALANSTQYDATKAKSLAEAAARAFSGLALLRAESDHQIYLALTDDQRLQLEKIGTSGRRP